MKERLTILTCALVAMALNALADDGLRIEPFEIAANETKEVNIILDDAAEAYCGLEFDLYLPEGVELCYDEDLEEYMCEPVKTKLGKTHSVLLEQKEKEGAVFYRFLVSDMKNRTIGSGDIYTLTIKANDRISTGLQEAAFRNVVMSDAEQHGPEIAEAPFEVTCQVPVSVTSMGYATFSWPRTLDFADSGAQAFIVTEKGTGSVRLEEVQTVPAGTGVLVKADEGTYYPQTTEDEATGNDVSRNLLTGTATGSYTVADADNVYVLSNLSGGEAGLYVADAGVTIAQYKAYLALADGTGAKDGLVFDFTQTGLKKIDNGQLIIDNSPVYNLNGQRVEGSKFNVQSSKLPKGVYIVNGKKVVLR